MIGILGHTPYWQQKKRENKLEAYLVLAGLYLMMALPILMIFRRWMADSAATMLGILLLVSSIYRRDWRWCKEPPALIMLGLWVYSALIVTPLAGDPVESLTRATWIRFGLMFAAIVYWLSEYRHEIRRIAWITLGFLIFVVIDSQVQYITGTSLTGHPINQFRLTGPFNKVIVGIFLAKMSLPCIGILMYYAWTHRNKPMLAFIIMMLTGIFATIILSNERTALITFVAALGVIGIGLFIKLKPLRLLIVLVALLQLGVLATLQITQAQVKLRNQQSHEMLQDFGSSPYVQLWKASYLIWQENPVFGTGMKNFRLECPKLQEQGLVSYCDLHSHNTYLEFLSELGAVGFFGLALLITSFVLMIVEQRAPSNKNGYIVTMFAAATIMIHFFPFAANQSFFANWPSLLAWQSIAWSLAIARSEGKYGHG